MVQDLKEASSKEKASTTKPSSPTARGATGRQVPVRYAASSTMMTVLQSLHRMRPADRKYTP